MKLGLQLNVGLQQTLTPQQIQYLKLLQLPSLQMEHYIRQEIEQNPMVEEVAEDGSSVNEDLSFDVTTVVTEAADIATSAQQTMSDASGDLGADTSAYSDRVDPGDGGDHGDNSDNVLGGIPTGGNEPELVGYDSADAPDLQYDSDLPDDVESLDFQKMLWDEGGPKGNTESSPTDDDSDFEPFQIKDVQSFEDDLLEQLHFAPLSEEEMILGEQIIGNLDDDGYLRRDLGDVLDDTNAIIEETNHERRMHGATEAASSNDGSVSYSSSAVSLLNRCTMQQAERTLHAIQEFEPIGCAARTVQECLIAQLRALPKLNAAQKLAYEVLTKTYPQFTMKHYAQIAQVLEVTDEYLREALDVIRKLNPKPGYGSSTQAITTIIPDFTVEATEDHGDFIVSLNDTTMPQLRVSKAYENLKREARYKQFNKDTREWLRKKHEDAKFLMSAIRQRKTTLLKVMTTIVELQKSFFAEGPSGLRPLIYKDVAEDAAMDISTVCRVVNNKYVQTEFGIFELRFFFSESLTNDEGDEVSTRVIKEKIRDIISKESKNKPWSDDKLTKELKKEGYNIARRTVAKYREQLKIPVARLRKEL
ncbi:MAG: RNA polymerase factor sigma-54 [Candidatus Kapaibacterium sp.]|jgi:RNA polymerase sigma-54 factor